jgi:hypothetical protein
MAMSLSCGRLAARAAALLALAWGVPAAAQETSHSPVAAVFRACTEAQLRADPQRVSVADGRVSLVPPPGMRALTAAEIEQRPAGERGDLVLVGDEGSTSIAVWFMGSAPAAGSPAANLYAIRMEYLGRAAGGMRWNRRGETVELGGARWLAFDYSHRLGPATRYVQQYATGFQSGGVMVKLTTTSSDRERRAALAASAATLRVHDCHLPDGG